MVALSVFDGPGGRELLDALILAGYLIATGYALVLFIAYRLHRRRQAAEARLRLVYASFESSLQGAMICDTAGAIQEVNAAFERLTGYARSEAVGRNLRFLASTRHDPEFIERVFDSVTERDYWEGEMWHARKGGELHPVQMTVSAVRDGGGRIANYAASFVDITERKLAEQRIRHLALHDILTDLPNRKLLRERAEAAIARAQRDRRLVALLFLDLDRFKNVNDSLGHTAGDQLLRQCAARLLGVLRAADLVGRQGGDEFVVLLPDLVKAEDAARIAGTMIEAVRRPFAIGGRELRLTCSIGISLYPQSGADFDVLMQNADTAMYAAKSGGRDCYRFHSGDMTRRASERLEIESELRQALESGALSLAYQAQHGLRDGELVGMEALLRWQHPRRGALSPMSFVPIAEDSGLILPLGEWVLREACAARASWFAHGLRDARVAVNVSAPQFREPGFVGVVERAIADSGLPAKLLELEVTESVIIAGVDQVSATLAELARLGVRISIDDFGTGYSSLAYLKRLPVDKLKIDRSFVMELPDDPDSCAIAAAVVGLAHSLQMRAIAEGVETERQARYLQACGCEEAQGYLFSKPLDAGAFQARYLGPARGP
ncbi:MAG: EAL domain-containing protein [Betaproteobacteria bacterium]|nr:EAL domain-containing protein [Betaproteobacteria bacterium]